MRIRILHVRWCLGLVLIIIVNIHLSLWVRRVHEKAVVGDLNQPYLNSYLTGEMRRDNGTDQLYLRDCAERARKSVDDYANFNKKINKLENIIASHSASEGLLDNDKEMESRALNSYIPPEHYSPELTFLPSFASDESEYLLSSLIERSALSSKLYLTTFMLSHQVLDRSSDTKVVNKVHPVMMETWKRVVTKFKSARYLPSGARTQTINSEKFYCEIKHSAESKPYIVSGEFLPNRLTSDSNANRLLDILRCPLKNPRGAYQEFAASNNSISVNILRGNVSLATFSVQWKTRRTGYLLSNSQAGSRVDSWKGHDLILRGANPNSHAIDKVHVCVTTSNEELSKDTLPLMIEFISHHLLIGASHISLPVPYAWNSPSMNRISEIFQSFIKEGKLSIVSQSGDGIEMVRSTSGLSFAEYTVQILQVNMCLHFSRGLAEYIYTSDIQEFFVPKGKNWNFLDVFKSVEPDSDMSSYAKMDTRRIEVWRDKKTTDSSHGWAVEHAHPFCFILIDSEFVLDANVGGYSNKNRPWVGQRFPHGPELAQRKDLRGARRRAFLPTERVFQASTDGAGACNLPIAWTSCSDAQSSSSGNITVDGFCGDGTLLPNRFEILKTIRYSHDFDEVVTTKDSYSLDSQSEGSVLHHLHKRPFTSASDTALQNVSIYTDRYFDAVMEDLRNRGLELMMRIPEKPVTTEPTAEEKWDPLFAATDAANIFARKGDLLESSYDYNLPNNFSRRSEEVEVQLPNFSIDFKEYVLGAMIERVSDSYELYATVFFLCHTLLEPQNSEWARTVEKISSEVYSVWKTVMNNFEETQYTKTGIRKTPPAFYCNISHTADGPYYIVEGSFVPNRLTPDSNANRRLDIFRCKMEDTESAYMNLARTSQEMRIEILRGDFSLLSFRIPWGSRKTGYMLDEPDDQKVSIFDPWKGFNKSTPGNWTHDRLYMCVPGWEDPPSKASLPVFLEWIQHHIHMGASHIFAATAFAWDSPYMHSINRVLSTFIDDGYVSITSHSGDKLDGAYSTGGLKWGRDNIKNIYVNMCTYYSKGTADYVGVWDFDEFFQPRGTNKNILDVIDAMEPEDGPIKYFYPPDAVAATVLPKEFVPRRGMADNDGHPFCYLALKSEVTLFEREGGEDIEQFLHDKPWIGQRFKHGHEPFGHYMGFIKSIRPTRTTFQGGLHVGGACRLPPEWNGCKYKTDFCYSKSGLYERLTLDNKGVFHGSHINHYFDELVLANDGKLIEPKSEGVLNHVQYRRRYLEASKKAKESQNDYSTSHFPSVYEALEKRGLIMPIELREQSHEIDPHHENQWMDFLELNDKIIDAEQRSLLDSGEVRLDPANLISVLSEIRFADIEPTDDVKRAVNDEESGKTVFQEDPVTLPSFSSDGTEMILASMIERQADSWDLHLTTFLMCHKMIQYKHQPTSLKASRIRPDKETLVSWSKAFLAVNNTVYLPSGIRSATPSFFCKIKESSSSVSYTVQGEFMPNELTVDINANERLDIMRCKMNNGEESYMNLARSNQEITVEIFREKVSLVVFTVPWNTRVQSRFLSHPRDVQGDNSMGTSSNPRASIFDPWMGFNKSTPGVWEREKLFMCVPGLESPPSRENLPLYLEFIQHHLLMGASHIFITAAFAWGGNIMKSLQRVLRSFIEDGSVSMTSHADDALDFLYSVRGLSFYRDNLKVFQVNFCAYFSKGVADNVAVWDVDEFFIPKGENKNMLDLIDSSNSDGPLDSEVSRKFTGQEGQNSRWHGGRGWADGNAHPYCFLEISSVVVGCNPPSYSLGQDTQSPWIGNTFDRPPEPKSSKANTDFAFKKSIFPTKTLYQFGLHAHGACDIQHPWSGCKKNTSGFCYEVSNIEIESSNIRKKNFRTTHSFIDKVMPSDTKRIGKNKEAVLYHMMFYRQHYALSNDTDITVKNDYTVKYFPRVMEALKKRNLDLLIDIPLEALLKQNVVDAWIDYTIIYRTRKDRDFLPSWFNRSVLH